MDTEGILQRMIDAGIVETNDGDVFPTAAFEARRSEIRASETAQPPWLTADLVDSERLEEERFIATMRTVAEFTDGMTEQEIATVGTALDRLEDPPTAAGVPEEFVPLHQEDLRGFLAEHRASVIFVWTPRNPSCERMAETLSRLHTHPTVDGTIGLGSICVEDGAELLREEYAVGILPTTLYFVGRSVDARAIGHREFSHVNREIEIITNDTSESRSATPRYDR